MTAEQRLFFGSVVLLVFMAGGFAAGAGETCNGRHGLAGDETKPGPSVYKKVPIFNTLVCPIF